MPSELGTLEEALGHRFARPERLVEAVTHPSVAGMERAARRGRGGTPYERLEFLGDRVLGLVIAEWLFEAYPEEREGDLAKRHVSLVRREALGAVAEAIGLGRHLRLSPGEEEIGGRANPALLADACEAVIGALFLDGGYAAARSFIRRAWAPLLERGVAPPQDPKTALQEWAQARGKPLPTYEMVERSGPAHDPVFVVRVTVAGLEPATGRASSKRVAEKEAASMLLRQVDDRADD